MTLRQRKKIFGSKTVVLGGGFRQILPVIPGKGRANVVDASISKSAQIWPHCVVFKLQKNMRLMKDKDNNEVEELEDFAKWVLDIGDGNIPANTKEGEDEKTWIGISRDLLLPTTNDPIGTVVSSIYPALLNNYTNPNYLQGRAILAPKNELVDEIN
ncbi:uncharacterized protein LOC141595335 [Silene latifolia]|uniref:uncharacterized protein LOC141595335 n=1 Tax=Silene latifolia TaxID=37657 RepID=UPI003D78AA73